MPKLSTPPFRGEYLTLRYFTAMTSMEVKYTPFEGVYLTLVRAGN